MPCQTCFHQCQVDLCVVVTDVGDDASVFNVSIIDDSNDFAGDLTGNDGSVDSADVFPNGVS
ncbi:MAG: hypothetical protein MK102_09730 [Fuerstiella sp.]|nr:hypothetical protein [Fuerstiella sp.]